MPKKNLVQTPKIKLTTERYSNRVVHMADSATHLNYASTFIFKGFAAQLGDIFTKNERYFFAASMATTLISNMAYLYRFIVTPNKNMSRIANLTMRAISLGLFAILTFGAAVIASQIMTVLLVISATLFPIVHAIKGFYFLYKTLTAEPSHKQFFKDKMITNFLTMAVSTLIVAGLGVLLVFGGAIAAPILNTIGVAGAALIVGVQIWKAVPFLKNVLQPEAKDHIKRADTLHIVRSASKRLTQIWAPGKMSSIIKKIQMEVAGPNEKIIAPAEPFNFYQYSVTKGVNNVKTFVKEIDEQKENTSKPHKKEAYRFLKLFSENMYKVPAAAPKEKKHMIGDKGFYYKNKEELVDKIHIYIMKKHSSAFFSPRKDIGRVEALYRAGYHHFLKPEAADTIGVADRKGATPKPKTKNARKFAIT